MVEAVLSLGSLVDWIVVGCGRGVMVTGLGLPVTPPVIIVVDPTVSVDSDNSYVVLAHTTIVLF